MSTVFDVRTVTVADQVEGAGVDDVASIVVTDQTGGVWTISTTTTVGTQVIAETYTEGPPGPQGPPGPPGEGIQGPQGEPGVSNEPGPQGEPGPPGPQGVKGDQGSGVTIVGNAPATAPPAPTAGQMWIVGTPVPTWVPASASGAAKEGDGVVWTGTAWSNVGPIRGPQGEQGPAGPQGIQGVPGATGAQGVPGVPGATGPQGIQGVQGSPGYGVVLLGEVPNPAALPPVATRAPGNGYVVTSDGDLYVVNDAGTAWVDVGQVVGPQGVQGVQGVPGPQGVQGVAGPTGPSGESAGMRFYPDPTDASDIATYKKLQTSPSGAVESTLATVCTGTGDVLVATFATDPGVPGAVDYPAGTASRTVYAMVSAGTARLHLQVYKRTAGGVETLVRDELSDNFTNTAVAAQEWSATAPAAGALLATDRIVTKLYAQRVSGSASITVTTFYEGTAHTSQIQTTISVGAQGPPGPQGPTGPAGPDEVVVWATGSEPSLVGVPDGTYWVEYSP